MNDRSRAFDTPIVVSVAAPRPSRPKRLERAGRPARVKLTDRDRAIFRTLAVHRLLSSEQLRRLHFPLAQPRRVRRRLRQLYDARLLDREAVVAQPQFGVPPFLYSLSPESAELAAADLGRPVSLPSSQSSSLRFVAHHVGVSEFFVTLVEALRATGWRVGQWRHEWDLKTRDKEGASRAERVHVTDPETKQERPLTVLPDAYFTVTGGGAALHYFFEFDRSTHRLGRWRDRALAFTAYARQGRFRHRFGGENFRLLVLCRPDFRGRSRAENSVETIHRAVGPSDLFRVTTTSELNVNTLFEAIWRQPGSAQPVGAFEQLTGRRRVVRVRATGTDA